MRRPFGVSVAVVVATAWSLSLLRPQQAFAGEPVDSMGVVQARAFLEAYQASSSAQTPGFYDLYSDRAVIHARIHGQEQGVVFQGRAYKQWGRDLAQSRRAAPEVSEFHEPTVEQRGARLVVRAKRYSITRCYWDLHYEVALEKEDASYRIVDERLTTNPGGVCLGGGASATAPQASMAAVDFPAIPARRGPPSVGERNSWRPLSQAKIAESALRLAEQMASKTQSQVRSTGLPIDGVSAAPPVARMRPAQTPSALWITPEN